MASGQEWLLKTAVKYSQAVGQKAEKDLLYLTNYSIKDN